MKKLFLIAPICASFAAGCMTTPPLSEATGSQQSNIMIKDVVQRVKCELSEAFDRKVEQPEFLWLASWTAHADLTLTINDNAGISPSGSFTQYQKNAVNFAAGPNQFPVTAANSAARAVSQQFLTVSAGATLNGQAIRTETLSFTMALDELKLWRENQDRIEAHPNFPPELRACNFDPSAGITGNLGLQEWVDSAFFPAEIRQLEAGVHTYSAGKAPSVSAPAAGPVGPKPAARLTVGEAKKNIKEWQSNLTALETETKADSDVITSAKTEIPAARDSINAKFDDVERQYKYVLASYLQKRYKEVRYRINRYSDELKTCSDAQKDISYAQSWLESLKDSLSKAPSDAQDAITIPGFNEKTYNDLSNLMEQKINVDSAGNPATIKRSQYVSLMRQCTKMIRQAKDLPNKLPDHVDPPIDSILHSVTFVVNYGANVTPSWTLLQWKGPGQNPNFLSASGVRTHLLVISIGPRAGAPSIGPDPIRLITLQAIRSINQQQ